MLLITDANILFSALIKDGLTRKILLLSNHEFVAPEFVLAEINKHIHELREKTNLSETEIKEILSTIIKKSNLTIISNKDFCIERVNAISICPDINDVEYFSLALHLNCSIWSNDKLLKNQNKVKIISTSELEKQTKYFE